MSNPTCGGLRQQELHSFAEVIFMAIGVNINLELGPYWWGSRGEEDEIDNASSNVRKPIEGFDKSFEAQTRLKENQVKGVSSTITVVNSKKQIGSGIRGRFKRRKSLNMLMLENVDNEVVEELRQQGGNRSLAHNLEDEIKVIVWDCCSDKTSEPNGLNCCAKLKLR
ncbi:hypothetical protein Ancab_023399 [Ancistrocladus abbreviatus]